MVPEAEKSAFSQVLQSNPQQWKKASVKYFS